MSILRTVLAFGIVALIGASAWFGFEKGKELNTSPVAEFEKITPVSDLNSQVNVSNAVYNETAGYLQNESNTIDVVSKMGDGVAFVAVEEKANPQSTRFSDFFGFQVEPQPQSGTGSGFVIDDQGHILTNFHVIKGADKITVKFHNVSQAFVGTVIGTAESLDVALIKVDAPKSVLHPMVLGDSSQVKVGQKAVAMGNPFGLEFTVTEGIISAVRRNPGAVGDGGLVNSVLQTDASINPGNSGGPLLNSAGEVIGINTAIYSTTGGYNGQAQSAGIGFAIPINVAKDILADLKAGKNLNSEQIVKSRPRLGITVANIGMANYPEDVLKQYNLTKEGLMVQSVDKNSPAAKAGLKGANKSVPLVDPNGRAYYNPNTKQQIMIGVDGDVIVSADGVAVNDISDLISVVQAKPKGQDVVIKIWRAGKNLELKIQPEILN